MLPYHHQRKLLCQVPLQVCHLDLHVIGAGEQVVRAGGEAHGAHVAAVGVVALHHAAPADVVQHAARVLLARGQQPAAGIHCH